MKRRFVVILNNVNRAQNLTFLAALKQRNLSWWNWVSDSWMIVDDSGTLTAESLRDLANIHYPGGYKVVLQFNPDGTESWAGYGPTDSKMFGWIRETWMKP